jgi:hypothetical protein
MISLITLRKGICKKDTLVDKMNEYITECSKFISKDISRNAALEKILDK